MQASACNTISAKINIHETAHVHSTHLGEGTRVWQFVVILAQAKIGRDVNICSHCFIENDVIVGDRVTIKSNVSLWDGIRIGNDVFIGPNVTFANDKFPRSKQYPDKFLETRIEDGASIGAGAVILPGITIGTGAMIGAGAVVTKSVPPHAVVTSPAAHMTNYIQTESSRSIEPSETIAPKENTVSIGINGVTVHYLKKIHDARGDLSIGEFSKDIPFKPKRYFLVFNVPDAKIRGGHAHYEGHQFLICVKGSCVVAIDDGKNRKEVLLDSAEKGVYLPPLTWATQYRYSSDAVLLVFASDFYNAEDYVHDYATFCEIKRG